MKKIGWICLAILLSRPCVWTQRSGDVKELPLFTRCTNYENNLSAIAADIEFIVLDQEPLISDFHVMDVTLIDDYIFLQGMYDIRQYDRTGKFIRNIGSRGMGPAEYVQLNPPLEVVPSKQLIYAHDIRRSRINLYTFDGKFVKTVPNPSKRTFTILDDQTIALRQSMQDHKTKNCPSISFMDHAGKDIKSYPSRIYPTDVEMFSFFPEASFLWQNNGKFYHLESGADTIYRLNGTNLEPVWVLTGNLKPTMNELFARNMGSKRKIVSGILRPDCGVFEGDRYMIIKLNGDTESYYMIYDKAAAKFSRTHYPNAPVANPRTEMRRMDHFIDDIATGRPFRPEYQSQGKLIGYLSAIDIAENQQEILDYIQKHPNKNSEKMRKIVQEIDEEDNSILVVVSLK